MSVKHIGVIGGGITGLTATYELQKHFARIGQPVRITLLEKGGKLGGAIQTLKRDGFVIEKGPDSFLARKPAVLDLSKDLDLMDHLVGMSPAASKSYIYLNGRLHPMPAGLAMGIPTQMKPFIGTRLLSIPGKARAALDLVLPKKKTPGDESLGSLIERRLGSQVADRLVGPILAGIYAGDLHRLSTAATFPQLQAMEEHNRSLILGMVAARNHPLPAMPDPARMQLPPHLRGSMFLTYKGGLGTLVERLADALQQAGTQICLNSPVRQLSRQQEGYAIHLSDQTIQVDRIILAVPAEQAQSILQHASTPLSSRLEQIPSVSVANVVMAFDQAQFKRPLQGSGFVIPRQEGLFITACTWTSMKWSHTAPEGKVLLRAYVGHWADQTHVQLTDQELTHLVLKDLTRILGEQATPLFTEISRHSEAMSQYLVGHVERLQAIEDELGGQFPNLVVAGRSYRGVGIPDCVAQGKAAAQRLYRTNL
ncbi:protoporphyrinogen oxidase [Paenibacillus rigui]|uniref:Coproporphyrinogen III oxidase n=1 Tax=Paenibacillus rigui TaxID=554312 RepID=A0A229UVW2_9BACL|nr:protoporphyrinogen oxidase [Paenibacillus rigui]OXM87554.1 protoporphyrinogen oxidase [Paenibacillus rigui]